MSNNVRKSLFISIFCLIMAAGSYSNPNPELVQKYTPIMSESSLLYLFKKLIGDEDAIAIAEVLKTNRKTKWIVLFDNKITDIGAISLAKALKINSTLKKLDLRGNQIGPAGGKALVDALQHNTSLIQLDVYGNPFWPGGLEEKIENELIKNREIAKILKSYPSIMEEMLSKFKMPDSGSLFSKVPKELIKLIAEELAKIHAQKTKESQ